MRVEAGVAFLEDDLVLDNATRLLASCESQMGAGVRIFDLSGVGRLDSSALSLLLALKRRAAGSPLQFNHVPESLTSLTRLYGIDDQF
jgi:ABC-type transporter Mla MlaB component